MKFVKATELKALLGVLLLAGMPLSVTAQTGLDFSYANAVVSGSTLEFDIIIKATDPGTKLADSQVYLNYNEAAFGPNVKTNAKITATKGTIVSGATESLVYGTITINDNSATTVSIALEYTSTAENCGLLPQTVPDNAYVQLFHVVMEMIDETKVPALSLDVTQPEPDMNGQQFVCTAGDGGGITVPYSPVTAGPFSYIVLPIELEAFTAVSDAEGVDLEWSTVSEQNNAGFEVERSTTGDRFERLAFVEGAGTSLQRREYSYRDEVRMPNVEKLYYRLKQVDFDGAFQYSPVVEVASPQPTEFKLLGAYPNPFNGRTVVSYELPDQQYVSLRVFDALGRQVKSLVDMTQSAGRYAVPFEATGLPSGMYIFRIEAGQYVDAGRILYVK